MVDKNDSQAQRACMEDRHKPKIAADSFNNCKLHGRVGTYVSRQLEVMLALEPSQVSWHFAGNNFVLVMV